MIKALGCKNVEEIVYDINRCKGMLTVSETVELLRKLNLLIEMHNELGILNDLKSDLLISKNSLTTGKNLLISAENIIDFDVKEKTIDYINMLDEQCLLVILNEHVVYIDVNYEKMKKLCVSESSNMLGVLSELQSLNFFNNEKVLNEVGLHDMYKKIVVSADFEKNDDAFKYLCEVLSGLQGVRKVYSKK